MTALAAQTDRDALLTRYREVRATTEALAAPLSPEDQVVQSMPDVSPTKWHRAHTTWFFEMFLLSPSLPGYTPFHPAYGYLFNSYYEAAGPRHARPERGLLSRPTVEEVTRYRACVDAAMETLITRAYDDVAPLVELGLHHEQQHQELLLMDIKHVLSRNPMDPAYGSSPPAPSTVAAPTHWVEVEVEVADGLVEIGHAGAGFAFDNETPRHTVHLEPFRIADRLVTNGEWSEFVGDGGYERPELWLFDGWCAARANGWRAPLYWGDDGTTFTLAGRQPIDPDEPVVHVSHYEADAYARWRGARLPTEHEWEHAVVSSGGALRQITDGAWQWTSSAYLPYPRFRPAPGAVGEYNGKFMSGQMVLRGGACTTPDGHARPTYRNFFAPASRWLFGGVRLADDAS